MTWTRGPALLFDLLLNLYLNNSHEVVLTQKRIELLLTSIEEWLTQDACTGKDIDLRQDLLSEYRFWIESGADASTMQAVCPHTRTVAMGVTHSMRKYEPLE